MYAEKWRNRLDLQKEEQGALLELGNYIRKVLKDLYAQGKLRRIPNCLYKNNLLKKFPSYTSLIEKIDSYGPKHRSGLHEFYFDAFFEPVYCEFCGNNAIFINFTKGYKHYCNNIYCYEKIAKERVKEKYGTDNIMYLPETKEKIKETNKQKYGTDWFVQTKEFKETVKKNNLEKYNVEWHTQLDNVKEKAKQTLYCNYGVTHPLHSKEIQDKVRQTVKEKYGVDNVFQSEVIKQKIRNTNLQKYGTEIASKSDIVKNKISQTIKEKYGSYWFVQTKEFKEKVKQNNLEKYGIEWNKQRHIKNKNNLTKNFIEHTFIDEHKRLNIKEMCEYYNISYTTAIKYVRDFSVNYKEFQTQAEIELYSLFKELSPISNTRKVIAPKELDLYFPQQKIAIEYNGLMYHSFGKSKSKMFNNFAELNPKMHLEKTNLCENKGIQLLYIFENEWINPIKRNIWISILRSKLGLIQNKIYARKCTIKEISNKEAKEFLNSNHIQGFINSQINIGLIYNNELVAVMSFSKSRFDKNIEWELIRFANKVNTIVIGGFSKLLNYFETKYNPKSLVSYANRRWSNGRVYELNGFEFVKDTDPNYYYFKPNEYVLYSRQKFQKHKLKQFDDYDSNKTELQIMIENGYRIIYDCGNKKYVKYY